MAMIDVDLTEFDTDELIDALEEIFESTRIKQEKDQIVKFAKRICDSGAIEVKTVDDQMKLEHLIKVFDLYTSAEIEKLIPER